MAAWATNQKPCLNLLGMHELSRIRSGVRPAGRVRVRGSFSFLASRESSNGCSFLSRSTEIGPAFAGRVMLVGRPIQAVSE